MRTKDPLTYIKMKIDTVSHIHQLQPAECERCDTKPCLLFCPSQVFTWEEGLQIRYERCVECGACLRGCPHTNIHWDYPRAGYGISHEL